MYALNVDDTDRYHNLIADPDYVPYDKIMLNPLDSHNLYQEALHLASALRLAYKNCRFRPEYVFDPMCQNQFAAVTEVCLFHTTQEDKQMLHKGSLLVPTLQGGQALLVINVLGNSILVQCMPATRPCRPATS
jgi:hypothetical protein